jgi:hypothetical protein
MSRTSGEANGFSGLERLELLMRNVPVVVARKRQTKRGTNSTEGIRNDMRSIIRIELPSLPSVFKPSDESAANWLEHALTGLRTTFEEMAYSAVCCARR